jgi:membrane protein DedA with SNARE-associated domain
MSLTHDLHVLLGQYGSAAVFVALFFEHFGLPLPGETLLIGAAVLASRGEIPIGTLLATAWLGATLGNAVGFAIGRYGGRHLVLRHGAKVAITETRFLSVESMFARYGDAVLVGARFVVLLRQLSGIAAGTLGMGRGRFMALNALGAALWVGWWGLVSYWAGERVFDAMSNMAVIEYVLLALAAATALWLYLRVRRRRARL